MENEKARPIMMYVAELEGKVRNYQAVLDTVARYKWYDRGVGFAFGCLFCSLMVIVRHYV